MGKVQVEADIPQTVNYVATSVTIGTTTILEPNAPAIVTNSGTAQNAILNFGIPSTTADFSGYRTAAAQDIIDATKQPKTLSTPIVVDEQTVTTVEGALSAINSSMRAGKAIGEVYFSQSNSAVDNPGGLPLFTGELISNADNLYPQFYTWISNHASLCTTQADYDSRISTYGECPFYVIDTVNKTIRLPKLVNYLKMGNTVDGITQTAAGLPDHNHIEGFAGINGTASYGVETVSVAGNINSQSGLSTANHPYTSNASDSNSIYGNSNTVTPAHTTVFPWVCAYNTVVPASEVQAAQFQAALTSKADIDLSNVTAPHIVETYHNGTDWYRVWSDGWCEQGGRASTNPETVTLLKEIADTNGTITVTVQNTSGPTSQAGNPCGGFISTTQIFVSSSQGSLPAFWKVEGYIATGD